jgi:hypothetical protein
MDKKVNIDSLLKKSNLCVKCGSKIPHDDLGGKCELMECPKCKKK